MQNIDLLNTLLFATTFLALFFIILYIRELKNKKNIRKKIIDNAKKEVEERLYKDELTGLKNRKSLEDSIRGKDSVVAILLDVDAFEDLNELYGFINAEEVLKELSNILKEFEKTYDVVAYRLSDDIFALTNISNIPFENIFILIEELNKTFLNRKIFVDKLNVDIVVSMTMGISIFQEEPILTAAMALKKAKSLNQSYFVYNNELDSKELIIQSLYWREKIKNAVSENKIIPFYQPIVNRKKEVIKYESLMRIRDFDSNNEAIILTPDKFLGISFKTKQYLELSRIIISKSLDNLLKTQKNITINLSFKDILNYEFIDYLDNVLEKLKFEDRNRLVFEILESENLSDYDFLEEFVLKYKKLGVKIAIDDFGSGYSNFIRIIRLKPDYLKIDGSLIKNIDKDNNSYEIVKSIIAFSKTLNIKTIAEYVHSEEIFNLLLELDVDEFQGYYFGKPDEDFS
ncbi:GGDEF domain-containing phosphodiesterase [Aliarcobacter cryaerophilus]|uniref:EAL domain-containing protein n=1 Tax=Aliarcobacter cryaerophilus TaxID=28198 RepID=UPI0021B637FE|nr:GGDEF domain-containing phosphodiesterase [Aliarcobacter cryaerophilus]MCT7534922.1 GGDEF domain-containing phosphodiesterase [Aliarcobacter cryaerophilus]